MTVCFARGLGAAAILAMAGQSAHADLTAMDVWNDWKAYLGSAGYSVSGDEQSSGSELNVSNLTLTMPMPEGEGEFAITMGSLAFVENGDGSVTINMPDSIPMAFETKIENEDPVSGVLTVTHPGNEMVASGTPNDTLYSYSAPNVGFSLSSLAIEGEPVPDSVIKISAAMTNVTSNTKMQLADLRTYSQQMTADSLSYNIAFDDPETSDQGTFIGAMEGLGFDGNGAIPLDMDPTDFNKMLEDGFQMDGTFTYSAGSAKFQGVGEGESFDFASSSQGGSLGIQMDQSQLGYEGKQKQIAISVTGGELPLPLDVTAAETAFNLGIPVQKSEEQQDFAFGLSMTDFTMSDLLWSMFDPAKQLPRDPASIAVDLTGKAKILFNFLDPEVASLLEQSEETPAELHAVTINNLLVSMVGARLSGTGDFTFDNSDTVTFDGMPRPIGHVDLTLVGANALLDKLIAMGFVGNEEAMGARMMMGMLAVPGDEPDTLKSKLEINEQGHVLANGQRIQ